MKIGFIGLGNMGRPMVRCLAGAGHRLAVFDLDRAVVAALEAEGAGTGAASPRAAALGADVVITMLPTSDVVERVLTGDEGVLAGIRAGAVLLEMGSGVPAQTRTFAGLLAGKGALLLDAPVSGGTQRAEKGDLSIIVGGDAAVMERMRPVFDAVASTVTHVGPVGAGHAMKALNNLASAASLLIASEVLLIGKAQGLDPEVMVDVLNASTGMSNSTQKKLKPFVLSGSYNSGFGLDLMVKDLSIALRMASEGVEAAPFSERCAALWREAAARRPGQDHTEIARYSAHLARVDFPGQENG